MRHIGRCHGETGRNVAIGRASRTRDIDSQVVSGAHVLDPLAREESLEELQFLPGASEILIDAGTLEVPGVVSVETPLSKLE